MDTFMDKLAQKLTAQEMIKANAAADAEEMNKLKNQVEEYNACLEKLEKLIEAGNAKLADAKVDSSEVNRLVEEGIRKLQAVQQDTEALDKLGQQLEEMKQLDEKLAGQLGEMKQQLDEKLAGQLEEMKQQLDEKLAGQPEEIRQQLDEKLAEQLEEMKQQLDEKLAGNEENVHKECVKVYRNVQAVVVEEFGKQAEKEESATGKLQKKQGTILGVSIAALIVSVCSVVLQVLQTLNIKFF